MEMMLQSISRALQECGEKIAVAESVTGGGIQSVLSAGENALRFFEGGIVAYTMEQKIRHLNIDKEEAEQCNCVSDGIALQMAKGVACLFHTEWGIGITGYASPVPELNIFQLFAWIAFAYKDNAVLVRKIHAPGLPPGEEVRNFYIKELLGLFNKQL